MRAPLVLSWAVALIVGVSTLVLFGQRALDAHSRASDAHKELQLVSEQARQLRLHQQGRPDLPLLPQGKDALGARIASVLASCGLPATALASVNPHDDQSVPYSDGPERYIRRKASLHMVNVSLPKLGAFLQAWRAAEPDWVPAAIDINPTLPRAGSPGGDLPLNITITLDALFADTTGGNR